MLLQYFVLCIFFVYNITATGKDTMLLHKTIGDTIVVQVVCVPQKNYLKVFIVKVNNDGQPDTDFANNGFLNLLLEDYELENLICECLTQNLYYIADIKNKTTSQIETLIVSGCGVVECIGVNSCVTRSCFEKNKVLARTFEQLNIRKCLRVGGDLIVCGKIINDPVCQAISCQLSHSVSTVS